MSIRVELHPAQKLIDAIMNGHVHGVYLQRKWDVLKDGKQTFDDIVKVIDNK